MWFTSAVTIWIDPETETVTDSSWFFSAAVHVNVTLITVWISLKMPKETGFWLTIFTTLVEIEMKRPHDFPCLVDTSRTNLDAATESILDFRDLRAFVLAFRFFSFLLRTPVSRLQL